MHVIAVATLMEGPMTESIMAYLLGPLVMMVLGVALWAISHLHRDDDHSVRRERWLDTHHVDWMRHRH
jgi:hypothetical protein